MVADSREVSVGVALSDSQRVGVQYSVVADATFG